MDMKLEETVEKKKDALVTVIKEPLPAPVIQEPLPVPENLSEVFNFASSKDPDDQAAPDPCRYDTRDTIVASP